MRASSFVVAVLGASASLALGQAPPTPQRSIANPASPSVRLPTLELVAEYGCPAPCRLPETFGSYVPVQAVAAGTGNAFAVLTREPPYVHVWNLDTGKSTVFGQDGREPNQLLQPRALFVVQDTVFVLQGPLSNRAIKSFTMDGQLIGSETTLERFGTPSASRIHASPGGAWLGLSPNAFGGELLVRLNRTTSARETLDPPASMMAGSFATPRLASDWMSMTVAGDGSVAMGFGETAYRLLMIPGDGSPRIEGGRSIVPEPHSPEQLEQIRNPPPREPPAGASPALREALARIAATPPDPNRRINTNRSFFFYDAMRFDAQGRLWVNTSRGAFDTPRRATFDLFSPKLEFLGEIVVQAGIGDGFHIGSQLLVARTYRENSTTVTVWRIREP